MYIKRTAEPTLLELAREFKGVAIIGPRQSGKTTLARHAFPDKSYVNLEDPDTRAFANDDPRRFLATYPKGAILDEIQRAPALYSYLQQVFDQSGTPGLFILSGSQHFLLMEGISQTLAGRIGILKLLPLSHAELEQNPAVNASVDEAIYNGGYPSIHTSASKPERWYNAYISTYVERDMRQLLNVHDTTRFHRFLKLCAGTIGNLLNLTRIGADCGIDQKTARAWIGILETSFIVHRLMPHHQNFRKRLVKTPKLYFYDTGLACRLLGLESHAQLSTHIMRGALFENFVISEMLKYRNNLAREENLFFWRSSAGHEIDILVDNAGTLSPVEIKSGSTIASDWFDGLRKWMQLAGDTAGDSWLIYGGDHSHIREAGEVVPWNNACKPLK